MNEQELEGLLYKSEGEDLDFKRDQYPLTNNTEKGELIKDILAFSNSWRSGDAFIIVGVDEAKSAGRSTPVGVSRHLRDADLQQMVNSKTNRKVSFAYEEVFFKGLNIGVIRIPEQERPSVLVTSFGGLTKDAVYVRHGSCTEIAGATESILMATATSTPRLKVQLANPETRQLFATAMTLTSTVVQFDETKVPLVSADPWSPAAMLGNKYYKKQKAKYIFDVELLSPVGFWIQNTSKTLASNVRLDLSVRKQPNLLVIDEHDYPRKPVYNSLYGGFNMPIVINPDIVVHDRDRVWTINVDFGNVQPGASVWTREVMYAGSSVYTDLNINGSIFGDNISPIPVNLKIEINTTKRPLAISELQIED
jgi:hypothetical protein